jgi:hypothetical protein
VRAPWIVAACLIAGCSSLLGITDPAARTDGGSGGDGSGSDGKGSDGGGGDGPGDARPPNGSPVLLSEVVLAPTGGEMVEIVNTSPDVVDLSNYFLSDNGNYWRIPTGFQIPGTDGINDFVAQFPAGTLMPGHAVFTVAIASSGEFQTAYGIPPTFSVASGTMTVVSGGAAPNLTSGGEIIVLFFWDGASDIVQDADIVLAGSPSAANSLVAKSGAMQDGPDGDTTSTAYKNDAQTIPPIQNGTPGSGLSTKRIALETGRETHDGTGNGLAGEDETSEDTDATWDSLVFSVPDPGIVPAELLQ